MPQNLENVCAVIAVIDQESGFVANPAISNMKRIEQTIRDMIAEDNKLRLFFYLHPGVGRELLERIRKSKTERDIDLAYRWLVDSMLSRYRTELLIQMSGALVEFVESRNPIKTAGSMQVSVSSALEAERNYRKAASLSLDEVYLVRDLLYTRSGGLYNGIRQLLDYRTGYMRKIYRFADYNAGQYSSRNAAFQKVVADLSGASLVLDGDLLIYAGGSTPLRKASSTEQSIRTVARQFELALSDEQIRADLFLEKSFELSESVTFKMLRDLYRREIGSEAPYAIIPDITLESVKITRIFTTEQFAQQVDRRYQSCVRRAQ
jgi:hypothetical protein